MHSERGGVKTVPFGAISGGVSAVLSSLLRLKCLRFTLRNYCTRTGTRYKQKAAAGKRR